MQADIGKKEMIEKFSDEELKQIVKELGMRDICTKSLVCKEETEELYKIWGEKPQASHNHIFRIIDVTLCNYVKKEVTRCRDEKYGTDTTIKQEIKEEYKEMYREILEVIKKHNREWEGD